MNGMRAEIRRRTPEGSQLFLEVVSRKFGFVPEALAVMSESPELLKAYLAASVYFEETSLSPVEAQVALLTMSRENGCEDCLTRDFSGANPLAQDALSNLLRGAPLGSARLEAVREFAAAVARTRGSVPPEALTHFLAAGFTRSNAFEIVLAAGLKTLSDFAVHLSRSAGDAGED